MTSADVSPRGGAAEEGHGRVVVLTIEGLRAGLAVDAVTEILSVPTTELTPAPTLAACEAAMFDRVATVERDGRIILLINPKILLDAAERDLLSAIASDGAGGTGADPAP
ncbi:chemotaxis protein CheW [Siccirubricoccus sp. G192]|uniref:chemotaxis protein CheW n=1 Tax=Siccirubricoccus sp. G192 TaxID=2849651 RepID=UPI0020C41174|nr:chemotaxis protein CheW [Siccirubricoccus sp. G192]